MLTWNNVINYARNGNPTPDRRIEKTADEWRSLLTEEQYRVTRQQGTERAFSSTLCELFEPGRYACVCCDNLLFDATDKFDSGTGWPSFTQPATPQAIAYHEDRSHGMSRVETKCNVCDAHLGHVFPDGPAPSGLRYCINAEALKKVTETTRDTAANEQGAAINDTEKTTGKRTTENTTTHDETATFGGGCFWCTEALFRRIRGVKQVTSGYSGGESENPGYADVCSGQTGHAEVIQVLYDPAVISYEDLLRIHLTTHDPTTLNRQGADSGTQYRSIILTQTPEQQQSAEKIVKEIQASFTDPIVTEIAPLTAFYEAEAVHQKYYDSNPDNRYCQVVIDPKLNRFRSLYADRVQQENDAE